MDSTDFWRLFQDTGEPMAYLLYAAAVGLEDEEAEDELLPSA